MTEIKFILFIVGCAAAWWLWPDTILDTPLASLTLGMLGNALVAIAVGLFACSIWADN